MAENHRGPATPAAHGAPPLVDGDTVPHPPRTPGPPVTRRQWIYGLLCVVVALTAIVIGVAR